MMLALVNKIITAMQNKDDNGLKEELKHECELQQEEDLIFSYITEGYLVNLRRKLRRSFMLKASDPRSKDVLKSIFQIRNEKVKHLAHHYYMIHPFSAFRTKWELLMVGIFMLQLIIIPISVMVDNYTLKVLKIFLDAMCCIDIVLTFNSGYLDTKSSQVVLERKKVFKHYFFLLFFPDLVSSLNYDLLNMIFPQWGHAMTFFLYCSYFKIFRFLTLFKYIENYKEHRQTSLLLYRIFKLSIMVIILFLWLTSLVYVTSGHNLRSISIDAILECYHKVCYMLLGYGTFEPQFRTVDVVIELLILTMGFIMNLIVVTNLLKIVMRYSLFGDKYLQLVQQIDSFMKYKRLPESLQNRIREYYNFRFPGTYVKEDEMLAFLSPQLRQEFLLHRYMPMIEKTPMFLDLPLHILCSIIQYLKPRAYLAGDVIFSANTPGSSMYFLSSGTVAIYSSTGKEVCHLIDGASFGELCLLGNHDTRTTDAVAIEKCEIFELHGSDFIRELNRYPEIHMRMRTLAQDRLKRMISGSMIGEMARFGSEVFIGGSEKSKVRNTYYYA